MADKIREINFFSSSDLEDVTNERQMFSGANDFDFPQTEVPQVPVELDGTEDMHDAFFTQPRRRG